MKAGRVLPVIRYTVSRGCLVGVLYRPGFDTPTGKDRGPVPGTRKILATASGGPGDFAGEAGRILAAFPGDPYISGGSPGCLLAAFPGAPETFRRHCRTLI